MWGTPLCEGCFGLTASEAGVQASLHCYEVPHVSHFRGAWRRQRDAGKDPRIDPSVFPLCVRGRFPVVGHENAGWASVFGVLESGTVGTGRVDGEVMDGGDWRYGGASQVQAGH